MTTIDLNCDLGESFGPWRMGEDERLLGLVTSVNVACGFHAGDPVTMERTVTAALARGLAVGAHPGLPDLVGFGRREMAVSPAEAYAMVVYQAGALAAFVAAAGGRLAHVKPHGALYNQATRDEALAAAIARAVAALAGPALVGPPGSALERAAATAGVNFLAEAFADRAYLSDGSLAPRSRPGAVLEDPEAAAERAVRMVRDGRVATSDSGDLALRPRTLCVHGDGARAYELARAVRRALEAAGIGVQAP